MRRALKITSLFAVAGFVLTACSPAAPEAETKTLKVVYQKTDSFTALDTLFQSAKREFEAANQGVTVALEPILANDDDYGTKLALALRSPSTAPDVFYEDTFKVRSDVDAGYLLKLDSHLEGWKDWDTFDDGAKAAGLGTTAAHTGSRWAPTPEPSGTTKRCSPPRASASRGSPATGRTSWTPPGKSRPATPLWCLSTCTQARPPAKAP
ncbi:hypothetical protein AHiyo4_27830 [Arthrobacter sp. Hiyo4]|nr:hypothetical protein AHiyo4_27830 [Arthrobacter sp. Hiyo4]